MPAVICRGMDIRVGREDSSQAIRHRIESRLGNIRPLDDALDLFKPQRGFTNAHHANANVRRPAIYTMQRRRKASECEVPVAFCKLLKSPSGIRSHRVELDANYKLVRFQRVDQRSDKKIGCRYFASAALRGGDDRPTEEPCHHRHLGRWIRMRDAAAEGAAVAHGHMGDVMHRLMHDRQVLADDRVCRGQVMAYRRRRFSPDLRAVRSDLHEPTLLRAAPKIPRPCSDGYDLSEQFEVLAGHGGHVFDRADMHRTSHQAAFCAVETVGSIFHGNRSSSLSTG